MISRLKLLFFLTLVLSLLFGVVGCGNKEQRQEIPKKGTGIYYSDEDSVKLVKRPQKIDVQENGQLGAEELLAEMKKVAKNSKFKAAIPDKVIINSVTVFNNVASVDFSTGYKRIPNNEDLICRAAIVYTLTQLKAINYVEFYIAGQAMLDTDGRAIGALSRDSFVFGELPVDLEN